MSTRTRYGLRAVIELTKAEAKKGGASVSEIARKQGLSVKYLENIFSALRRAGIVKAVSGRQGGYRLLKQANEITVFDVMRAVGEGTALVKCVKDARICDKSRKCKARKFWKRLSELIETATRTVKLADFV